MINIKLLFFYLFFIINIFNSVVDFEYLAVERKKYTDLMLLIDAIDFSDVKMLMNSKDQYYFQNNLFFTKVKKYIKSKGKYFNDSNDFGMNFFKDLFRKVDKNKINDIARFTIFLTHKNTINNKEDLDLFILKKNEKFKEKYINFIEKLIEETPLIGLKNDSDENLYQIISEKDYFLIEQYILTINRIFQFFSDSDFLTDFEKNNVFVISYSLQKFFKVIFILLKKNDIKFYHYMSIYLELLSKLFNRMNYDDLNMNIDSLFSIDAVKFYDHNKLLYNDFYGYLKKVYLEYSRKYCKCLYLCDDKDFKRILLINKIYHFVKIVDIIKNEINKKSFDFLQEYVKQQLRREKLVKFFDIFIKKKQEIFNNIKKIKVFSINDGLAELENSMNEMYTKILSISSTNMQDIEYLNQKINNFNKKNNIYEDLQVMLDSLKF